jgi:excisionase family DNA binding protein
MEFEEEEKDYIYLPLLTVAEAAKYIGVGRKVVYQLIEFDRIKAVRKNGAVFIEKRSLDAFRDSGSLT